MTMPERMLWRELSLRPSGLKFRKQHSIEPYIVDFCCLGAKLIVEVDGEVHNMGGRPEYDVRRKAFLEANGFRVIRVSARRVLTDAAGTANAIAALAESPHHRPADGPPPRTGEDF